MAKKKTPLDRALNRKDKAARATTGGGKVQKADAPTRGRPRVTVAEPREVIGKTSNKPLGLTPTERLALKLRGFVD